MPNYKQTEAVVYQTLHGWRSEHPDFPIKEWQSSVCADNTRYGYWEWVHENLEGDYDEHDS